MGVYVRINSSVT